MSSNVVAQLAHEGVAVSMPILLFGGCRVGAPPRGAAVEHRGLWAAQAEMSAAQHAKWAPQGGPSIKHERRCVAAAPSSTLPWPVGQPMGQ